MALVERLGSLIDQEGPLRVRDFMEIALYDPREGYYAKGPAIGAGGDFYTASNASLFPQAVARFVKAALERLEGARVVELGGGMGEVARGLGLDVTIVEPSPGLAARQRDRGLRVVGSLDELRPAPTVFLANEVLDALPVHRLLGTPEGVREAYLLLEDDAFVEVPGPLSERGLARAAERLAPHLAPGASVEVCLEAGNLLDAMTRAAPESIALFLDYGGTPAELYATPRPDGTLRGFHQHKVTHAYERPGEQDITADVDFAWVAELARDRGYRTLGPRPQGEFLADLGLLDDLMAALSRGDMDAYLAGKNLIMPGGMGERFRALAIGRGAPLDPPLPGFRADTIPGAGRR